MILICFSYIILLSISSRITRVKSLSFRSRMAAKRTASSSSESLTSKKAKPAKGIHLDNGLRITHPPYSPENFNVSRARLLNPYEGDFHNKGDCVVYWMSRDQRIHDNYALLYAQGLAEHKQVINELRYIMFKSVLAFFGFFLNLALFWP